MAEITAGQALALGNLARPDTTKVFTQAAMNKQRLDLADKAAKAKQAEEERKMRKDMESKIGLDAKGFDPLYQDDAKQIATDYFVKAKQAADAGDYTALNAYKQQANSELANLQKENEQFRNTLTDMERSGISNKEISKILSMPKKDAMTYYEQLRQSRPETEAIVGFDPNAGRFSANYIKNLDLNERVNSFIPQMKESSIPNLDEKGQQKRVKVGNDVYYEWKIKPEAADAEARMIASDKDGVYNIMVKYPKQYRDNYALVAKEQEAKGQTTDPAMLQFEAARLTMKNELEAKGTYKTMDAGLRASRGSGRGITRSIEPIGGAAATPFKVKVLSKDGKEMETETVAYRITQLPIQNGGFSTADIKDAKTGKPYNSKEALTFFKTGVGAVMPFYKKGAKGKDKNGKVYDLGGQPVDGSVIDSEAASIEYKPVIIGQTNDAKAPDQVFIELDANPQIMNVLKKGSVGDEEQTMYDVNQIMQEAKAKNRELQQRLSKKGTTVQPKGTAKQTTKTVPLTKIKGLVGKAGYEGYTEKELVDYYKSQGYTIN